MKKTYKKPTIIIEQYLLNDNIAVACGQPVLFGPRGENSDCGDYGFGGDVSPFSLYNAEINPFYKDNCTCYYTAPEGSGHFGTS